MKHEEEQSAITTNPYAHTRALVECMKWVLADFRHEMANVLNGLTVTVDYLDQYLEPNTDDETAEMIKIALSHLDDARLAMAPIQQYERPSEIILEQVPVTALITTVYEQIHRDTGTAVQFDISIDPSVEAVYTNATALSQALYLLGMHLTRMFAGCKDAQVAVQVTRAAGNAVVISFEEHRPAICETVTSRGIRKPGDNFALFLAKGVLERLHGTLELNENDQPGEQMRITVPADAQP